MARRSLRNIPVGREREACGPDDRGTPPTSKWCFYDHGFAGGSQDPHPEGGSRRAGTLQPSVCCLRCGGQGVFSALRPLTTEVPAGCGAVHPRGAVLDLRWRCLAVASGLPTTRPFALPRKRFAKEPVLKKAGEYLGTAKSYAETVKYQGMPIMYDDRTPAGLEKASGLAPSTVWRWLSWLGGMPGTLRAAWGADSPERAQRHAAPPTVGGVAEEVSFPAAGRHAGTGDAVAGGRDRVCEGILGQGIFPRYAISQGWS